MIKAVLKPMRSHLNAFFFDPLLMLTTVFFKLMQLFSKLLSLPLVHKTLFEYIFHHENDVKNVSMSLVVL